MSALGLFFYSVSFFRIGGTHIWGNSKRKGVKKVERKEKRASQTIKEWIEYTGGG